MKKIKKTEAQIISILKEQESGLKVAEICRNHNISEQTFYNWKSKYGGMSVSDLTRMKDLEYENSRLKRMYANLSLENEAIKELLQKKF